jgi:hypothetical protein
VYVQHQMHEMKGIVCMIACMQIMDQIEGVNGQLLPWEGKRLTPQVRITSAILCQLCWPIPVLVQVVCYHVNSGRGMFSLLAESLSTCVFLFQGKSQSLWLRVRLCKQNTKFIAGMASLQVKSKLTLFQGALLQLLHRDHRKRPSMQQFCCTCGSILGEHTIPTVSDTHSVGSSKKGHNYVEIPSVSEIIWHSCKT